MVGCVQNSTFRNQKPAMPSCVRLQTCLIIFVHVFCVTSRQGSPRSFCTIWRIVFLFYRILSGGVCAGAVREVSPVSPAAETASSVYRMSHGKLRKPICTASQNSELVFATRTWSPVSGAVNKQFKTDDKMRAKSCPAGFSVVLQLTKKERFESPSANSCCF